MQLSCWIQHPARSDHNRLATVVYSNHLLHSEHLCVVQMKQYPPEVNHVVLLSAIPSLYPGLGILESLLKAFNHAPLKLLFKTGTMLLLATMLSDL